MKQILISTKTLIMAVMTVAFSMSCSDLDEQVFSQIQADNFFQSDDEFVSAVGAAYGPTASLFFDMWSLSEVSSDEVVVPTRGADWFDGGNWQRIHLHDVQPGDDRVSGTWPTLFAGVNAANQLIAQFGTSDNENAAGFINELRALRAYYYFFLLDLYGNVPISDDFNDTEASNNADFQAGRTAVYNWLENELSTVLAGMDPADVPNLYGRMDYYTIRALQAKLYLNAAVYKGLASDDAADLTAGLAAADDIIDNGPFRLEGDYYANFSATNDGSAEIIYAVVYDNVFAGGFSLAQMTLHYQSTATFGLTEQPWNGFSSLADFYNSYIDPAENPGPTGAGINLEGVPVDAGIVQDARNRNFLVGAQFELDGSTPISDAAWDEAVETAFDPNGTAEIVFTPRFNEFEPNACRQCGARIGKYQFQALNRDQNIDLPVFRFADVLLMKAEMLARQNGYGDAEALALVNQVRERAGVTPFATLSEDNLLAERGREMAFEYWRRNDLIRFPGVNGGVTRFNDPWEFKEVSDVSRNVFPIPAAQIQANDALTQNPGYDTGS